MESIETSVAKFWYNLLKYSVISLNFSACLAKPLALIACPTRGEIMPAVLRLCGALGKKAVTKTFDSGLRNLFRPKLVVSWVGL